jgi:hypothetical protein
VNACKVENLKPLDKLHVTPLYVVNIFLMENRRPQILLRFPLELWLWLV